MKSEPEDCTYFKVHDWIWQLEYLDIKVWTIYPCCEYWVRPEKDWSVFKSYNFSLLNLNL